MALTQFLTEQQNTYDSVVEGIYRQGYFILKMKKCLLLYILLSVFSFVTAQEYLPLHLNYKPTVVYIKEKKIHHIVPEQ